MTLLEVVFVCGLLGLFVLMVAQAILYGLRAHQRTMDRTYYYRQASVVLSRLMREISVGIKWGPPSGLYTIMNPVADGDLEFIRSTQNYSNTGLLADGQKLRYWRNPSPKFELVRKDVSGGTQRVVARQVTDFIVEPTVNNIKVTLIIKNNEAPLVAVGQAIKM